MTWSCIAKIVQLLPQGADFLVQREGGLGVPGAAGDGAGLELERAGTGLYRALLQSSQTRVIRRAAARKLSNYSPRWRHALQNAACVGAYFAAGVNYYHTVYIVQSKLESRRQHALQSCRLHLSRLCCGKRRE